jgi:hypothetical protein
VMCAGDRGGVMGAGCRATGVGWNCGLWFVAQTATFGVLRMVCGVRCLLDKLSKRLCRLSVTIDFALKRA